MKRFLVATCPTVAATLAFALPTVEAVQAAIAEGDHARAESHVFAQRVEYEQTAARPGNAADRAATSSSGDAATTTPRTRESAAAAIGGVPGWVWGLGIAALALAGWRLFGVRRRIAPSSGFPAAAAGQPAGSTGCGGRTSAAGAPDGSSGDNRA